MADGGTFSHRPVHAAAGGAAALTDNAMTDRFAADMEALRKRSLGARS
jgi:hypothetical protein